MKYCGDAKINSSSNIKTAYPTQILWNILFAAKAINKQEIHIAKLPIQISEKYVLSNEEVFNNFAISRKIPVITKLFGYQE